ncbi:MAG: sulfotransferase domain-containing protein [Pseudomonadota bacterium]
MVPAELIVPAARAYRGSITEPHRWNSFRARRGDVILATPSKSGTTWTQTMVAMLLHGSPELPGRVTDLSPWLDANFASVEDTAAALERQPGRRVVKTHTPVDGFPLWEGVQVISVFRHPLEMYLSLRKHIVNMKDRQGGSGVASLAEGLEHFLNTPFDAQDADEDTIMTVTRHFEASVLSGRLRTSLILNYAAMLRDHAGAIARLNDYLGTDRDDKTLEAIRQATAFSAMKANATQFAPQGGQGFWHDDRAFFASGKSGGWRDAFDDGQLAAYSTRFAELLPSEAHRQWIEDGTGWQP